MTAGLVMMGFALVIAASAPAALRRADWTDRAPALGVTAWLATPASVLAALLLGGVALAAPPASVGHLVIDLLRACVHEGLGFDAVGPPVAGLLIAVTTGARVAFAARAELGESRRVRAAHREALALIAAHDEKWGVVLIDHPAAAAYSVPGRPAQVVMTAGAVAALDDEQIAAVLAHERAHLTGRHHLLLAMAAVLKRTVPWLPLFRDAPAEVARLVELLADDEAARSNRPQRLAAALATLALATVPGAGLPAGGLSVPGRIRRLLQPPAPLPRWTRAVWVSLIVLVLAAPLALALGSALVAAYVNHHCTGAGPHLG